MVILNKYDLPQEVSVKEIKELAGDAPVVSLSARYGSGMEELEEALRRLTETQDQDAGRQLFLTNLRHVDLVKKALEAVRRARQSLEDSMPADCITVDLVEAWNLMGEITGETVDNELINKIFERFCVGK